MWMPYFNVKGALSELKLRKQREASSVCLVGGTKLAAA